jgi:membrane protease YdiL (CAAX protease family)
MIIMWIASSIVMTWLFNKTGGSVLVAGVIYHLMLDFSSSTLLADLTLSGLTEGIPPIDVRLLTSQIMVSTVVALALLVTTKGRLGKSLEEE